MLDRAKQLKILIESNRRCLDTVSVALEAFESGSSERTGYSQLARAFHTMKHDAAHLSLEPLARLAGACETIVGRAREHRLGLPLDLLRSAAVEIRTATEVLAAAGRHRLDTKILGRAEFAAKKASVD